jgi:hypothetical protein
MQGNSSTPEGVRKHLNPKQPACNKGLSWPRLPGTTPPQNPADTFSWKAATEVGCWNAVEGHFDDGRNAVSSGSSGCRRESLPFSSAGLIDMNMGIHQPRHNHPVTCIFRRRTLEGTYPINDAVSNLDRSRANSVRQDYTPTSDHPLTMHDAKNQSIDSGLRATDRLLWSERH